MTFQNVQMSRVFRAVMITSFMGAVLSGALCYCYLAIRIAPEIDSAADFSAQQKQIQDKIEPLMEDIFTSPPSTLNLLYLVQLGIVVLLSAWQTHWAALRAATPQQAVGYAVAVTGGVVFSYGILLVLFGPTLFLIKLLFFVALSGANLRAAQIAVQNIGKRPPAASPAPAAAPVAGLGRFAPPAQPGVNPETYYNMGVMAALGGRREEARQHFTRVLQAQPRHVPAWLQLANLADTPEQAWNYIQQARSISPTDPAVLQAVEVIWPKVAASAERQGPPRAQPPYPGGASDDAAIPRTTLPGDVSADAPTLTDLDANLPGSTPSPGSDAETGAEHEPPPAP